MKIGFDRRQFLAGSASAFSATQLTGKIRTPERYLDSQARFHRLGTDANHDPVLMKRGLAPEIEYEKIQSPYISARSRTAKPRTPTRFYCGAFADK
jgi:hypothetical protein